MVNTIWQTGLFTSLNDLIFIVIGFALCLLRPYLDRRFLRSGKPQPKLEDKPAVPLPSPSGATS